MSRLSIPPLAVLILVSLALAESTAPEGWEPFAVRQEIAPRFEADQRTLALYGNGTEATDGRWKKRVAVVGGRHYAFMAKYRMKDVETPARSVLARVLWLDARGKQVEQAEYPVLRAAIAAGTASSRTADEPRLEATYKAPQAAVAAKLELHLRWTAKGQVVWEIPRFAETSPPPSRVVRVASVNHRPRGTTSPEENLQQFAKFVDEAAEKKADIVCLPEGVTVCGTRLKYADVAEAVPGRSTEFLGQLAKKHNMYVVAGIYEREGSIIYNTSVLMGRDGSLAGRYRKLCLPREEIDGGITPGNAYPVFDTDFGRIGMMICWDLHYPEVARELSQRGAEVIFMPIWGGNETLAQARAIENQIHLVASGYDFPTSIYDRKGQLLSQEKARSGVIVSEIDLNERVMWPWLGDWRSRIWREAPVEAAGVGR